MVELETSCIKRDLVLCNYNLETSQLAARMLFVRAVTPSIQLMLSPPYIAQKPWLSGPLMCRPEAAEKLGGTPVDASLCFSASYQKFGWKIH